MPAARAERSPGPTLMAGALAVLALGVVSMARVSTARAHDVQPSSLELAFGAGSVEATHRLPADQLGVALAAALDDPSLTELAAHPERLDAEIGDALRHYVEAHCTLTDERGRAYAASTEAPRWSADETMVIVPMRLASPDGHSATRLSLHDDVIADEVVNHRTLVSRRADYERGLLAAESEVIGTLRPWQRELAIDRSDASAWRGHAAMLELGARHIAEGLDHLLFVLVLLLAAPLRGTRSVRDAPMTWGGTRSTRETMIALATIVTAFTFGHSLTLVAGALGLVSIDPDVVELLVACSIAIGALHAMRPLFAAREGWVAAGFGLVHGLAFASSLEDLGLRGLSLALALGAFNLGIELVQLATVLLVAPILAACARERGYHALRTSIAAIALICALAWGLERGASLSTPISRALELVAASPLFVWPPLALALVLWLALQRVAARRASLRRAADGDARTEPVRT